MSSHCHDHVQNDNCQIGVGLCIDITVDRVSFSLERTLFSSMASLELYLFRSNAHCFQAWFRLNFISSAWLVSGYLDSDVAVARFVDKAAEDVS